MPQIRHGNLTVNQYNFCNEYMRNGGVAGPAYRFAYKNNNHSDEICSMLGGKLTNKPRIRKELDRLRLMVQKKTGVTVAGLTCTLDKVVKRGFELDKLGDVTAAVAAIAKLNGLWIDRSKNDHSWVDTKTQEEIQREIEEALTELNADHEAHALLRRIQAQASGRAVNAGAASVITQEEPD